LIISYYMKITFIVVFIFSPLISPFDFSFLPLKCQLFGPSSPAMLDSLLMSPNQHSLHNRITLVVFNTLEYKEDMFFLYGKRLFVYAVVFFFYKEVEKSPSNLHNYRLLFKKWNKITIFLIMLSNIKSEFKFK